MFSIRTYLTLLSYSYHRTDRLKFAFSVYDLDRDGLISREELFKVAKMNDHGRSWQMMVVEDDMFYRVMVLEVWFYRQLCPS